MNTAIFIASHIYYDNQLDLLNTCLTSLINQTKHSDIFVSISFESNKYRDTFYNTIKHHFSTVTFTVSKHKLFQMEHIKLLTLTYLTNTRYDFIFFCDDDDTYDIHRVERFCSFSPDDDSIPHYDCIRENKLGGGNETFTEFWNYAVRPYVLHTFFNRISIDTDILKHNYADMIFRCYLRIVKLDILIIECKQYLYKYNKNNPHSVCATLKSDDRTIRQKITNNGMLALFHGSEYYKKVWDVGCSIPIRLMYKTIVNHRDILKVVDRVLQREGGWNSFKSS